MTTEKQADVRARIFGASDEEWLWMLTDGRAIDPALRNHLPRLPDEAILTWICADPVAAYDSGDYIYGEYPTERHFGRGYGEACISFAYAKQHWTPLFGQVAFIEANARIEQSVILARKPIGT